MMYSYFLVWLYNVWFCSITHLVLFVFHYGSPSLIWNDVLNFWTSLLNVWHSLNMTGFWKNRIHGSQTTNVLQKRDVSHLQQMFSEPLPRARHCSQECQIENSEESGRLRKTGESLPCLNALSLFIYFNQESQTRQIWKIPLWLTLTLT